MPAPSVADSLDPPQLLLLEPDVDLSDVLWCLLTEEGYQVQCASSLEQAVDQIDAQAFDLLLEDADVDGRPDLLTDRVLRRGVWPTPIGLLTRAPPEAVCHAGLSFAQRLPFDLDAFLGVVAQALDRPLTPLQRHEAEVVRRYFVAREAQDWPALLALCTEQVTLSPRSAQLTDSRRLTGRSALRAYLEKEARTQPRPHFEHVLLYGCRRGLVARCTIAWATPEGGREQTAGTTVFEFAEERICHVGCSVRMAGLRQHLMTLQAEKRWRRAHDRVSQTQALLSTSNA